MLNGMNLPFTGCLMMICLLIGSLGFREALTNLIAKFRRFTPYLHAIFRGINSTFLHVCLCAHFEARENEPIANPLVSGTFWSYFATKVKAFYPFLYCL